MFAIHVLQAGENDWDEFAEHCDLKPFGAGVHPLPENQVAAGEGQFIDENQTNERLWIRVGSDCGVSIHTVRAGTAGADVSGENGFGEYGRKNIGGSA
ncbi:MAG: hypothetical protein HY046_08215 [Acidobacteria bacterium]|nr:hypothetical protein [Acidobacteriota bacterium]